jgi:cyclophilin family peptidyl-prolyl cis-trans isomerase
MRPLLLLFACTLAAQPRPDGLYAEIRTSKGLIVARLEPDLVPLTVANFVGLAEGTIANAAFDPGHPFYDGTVYHRVVPGHVIQTGIPKSDRARNPGYSFPNEIHARLSHNHAGALNMANAGPNTNASQWCITLGDRSYLDDNFSVFGDVVEGMDVVMRIVQGDVVESVRILRLGAKAQAFHPTTESFRAQVRAAEKRVAEHLEKKRQAEEHWIAQNFPNAKLPATEVITRPVVVLSDKNPPGSAPLHVRYTGRELHYVGDVIGREGPPLDVISFASGETREPDFYDTPRTFSFERGKTKINPGLDSVIAGMAPGERTQVIVPAAQAYSRRGFYAPEVPGKRRLIISPDTMLVYDVEVLPNE